MVLGPGLYRFFFRHPIVFVIPFIFIFWYMTIQAWPDSYPTGYVEALEAKPLETAPPHTTPEVAPEVAPEVVPEVAPEVPTEKTPEKTPAKTSAIPSTIPSEVVREKPIENYAYVFYATNDNYACSALVNFHRLQTVFYSKVPGIILASSGVSNYTISVLRNYGLEVIREEPPPLPFESAHYYKGVLLKLRALRLHQIKPKLKRIQVFDSDQMILKNPESLFELPPVDIAAPMAYWLGTEIVTTTLLVANLSDNLWTIVNNAIQNIQIDEYDMDLINKVFGKRLMMLPGRYCTLNSHWEALDLPGWFVGGTDTVSGTDQELVELYKQAEILHFTAMGKPWSVLLRDVETHKPEPHPLLIEQFRLWKETATRICGIDYMF